MALNALAVPAKENYLQFDAERPCPLCQSSNQVVLRRRMQFKLDCITMICKQCGFCFVSPPPTREAYNRFYREAYAWYYRKIHSDRSPGKVVESAWQKARLDLIESDGLLAGKQVLEIGPGSGRFLQLAAGRGACCAAIEPSSAFREQLAGKGIRIVSDFLENADE